MRLTSKKLNQYCNQGINIAKENKYRVVVAKMGSMSQKLNRCCKIEWTLQKWKGNVSVKKNQFFSQIQWSSCYSFPWAKLEFPDSIKNSLKSGERRVELQKKIVIFFEIVDQGTYIFLENLYSHYNLPPSPSQIISPIRLLYFATLFHPIFSFPL